jgi:hypothetical protein
MRGMRPTSIHVARPLVGGLSPVWVFIGLQPVIAALIGG